MAPLGLLLAGMAVPALILRLLPRWLAWAGLVIAAVAELSTFSLLTTALDATLPAGRFGGLAWAVAASVLLPRSRRDARSAADRYQARPDGATARARDRSR